MGTPLSPPQKEAGALPTPNFFFGPCLLRPNGWMDESGTSQFSAHFYCAQTDGCIKMPLGMEVGLSRGEFVLDGDPALSPKGAEPPPNFKV